MIVAPQQYRLKPDFPGPPGPPPGTVGNAPERASRRSVSLAG